MAAALVRGGQGNFSHLVSVDGVLGPSSILRSEQILFSPFQTDKGYGFLEIEGRSNSGQWATLALVDFASGERTAPLGQRQNLVSAKTATHLGASYFLTGFWLGVGRPAEAQPRLLSRLYQVGQDGAAIELQPEIYSHPTNIYRARAAKDGAGLIVLAGPPDSRQANYTYDLFLLVPDTMAIRRLTDLNLLIGEFDADIAMQTFALTVIPSRDAPQKLLLFWPMRGEAAEISLAPCMAAFASAILAGKWIACGKH